MIRVFILSLFFMGMFLNVEAQNRSINFEQTKEWKQILKKAKKEKKLIFIDCYTSWCGPCKTLANDVFTQDAVADYFNANFVNAKYDMEKDVDGVALKTKFAIQAFPTLVFVDPLTQQVVHKMVGAGKAEWLIAGAKDAGDSQNNLSGLTKRYESGERDVAFIKKYLDVLSSAYMKKEQGQVASEYLNMLSVEQLATKENWELIKINVNDPLAKSLKLVMANRVKFYEIAGKELVDYKLETGIKYAALDLAGWRSGSSVAFDESRNKELITYLLSIDNSAASAALATLYTAEYARKGDFRGMLDQMKEVEKYNLFRNSEDKQYFQMNIESLVNCNDKALVQEGIDWISRKVANSEDCFLKAALMNSKARLQTKNGDTQGADKSKMEEEKYAKEGEARSGGRVMRAMRMN